MKKQYLTPALNVVLLQSEDIMALSVISGNANNFEPALDYGRITGGDYSI